MNRSSLDVLESFADMLGDAVITADPEGVIVRVSRRAGPMFGHREQELVGRHLSALVPGVEALLSAERQPGRVRAHHAEGHDFQVSVVVASTGTPERPRVTAVIRDLSIQQAAERELREQRDELRVQNEVNAILSRRLSLDRMLERVLRALVSMKRLGVQPKAGVFLVDRAARVLRLQTTLGDFSAEFLEAEAVVPLAACLCGRAAQSGQVLVCHDAHTDPRHERCYPGMVGHGHYIIPLRAGGRVNGVIFMYTDRQPHWDQRQRALLETLGVEIGLAIERIRAEETLERTKEHLEELTRRDHLTGLTNRRAILERLDAEWARAVRVGAPLSALMIDVDHFKRINDTLGHQAGDEVLKVISRRMSEALRRYDDLGRYGGEEFLVLLGHSGRNIATRVAERVLEAVRASPIRWRGQDIHVAVSIGVATLAASRSSNPAQLVALADAALLVAKEERNRVVTSP